MAINLSVVIVNYRTASLVIECLRSIAHQYFDEPDLLVVVVDNASGDGSVEKLREAVIREGWSSWILILPQDRNGGFAYGNNAGIRTALHSRDPIDYILLLNPDTTLEHGALQALVDFMDSNPRAGIAGSRIKNPAGMLEPSAHNAPSPLGELESGAQWGTLTRLLRRHVVTPPMRDTAHECDWVSGASLLIRRTVIDEIGDMDEGFFLYFEEVDYCLRARKAGWQIWFEPASCIVHLEGASTGIVDTVRRRPSYWYDSRRRYFVKHWGITGLLAADFCWLIGRASLVLRRIFRLGSGGNKQDPKWFAIDLLWGDIKALFSGWLRKT